MVQPQQVHKRTAGPFPLLSSTFCKYSNVSSYLPYLRFVQRLLLIYNRVIPCQLTPKNLKISPDHRRFWWKLLQTMPVTSKTQIQIFFKIGSRVMEIWPCDFLTFSTINVVWPLNFKWAYLSNPWSYWAEFGVIARKNRHKFLFCGQI